MYKFFFFLISVFIFSTSYSQNRTNSKNDKKSLEGMKLNSSGYYFKSHVKSKSKVNTKIGDVMFIEQTIFTDDDSLIFDSNSMMEPGQLYALKIDTPSYKGDMFEVLINLRKGDSVSFALRIDDMFKNYYKQAVPEFLLGKEFLIYHLKVDSVIDKEIVALKEKEQEEQLAAMNSYYQIYEDSTLSAYVVNNKIESKPTESGMYYLEKNKGTGNLINLGDSVTVNYTGMFLDGTVFDSSIDRNETFSFVAGVGEVIPGWDEAIVKMNEGAKVSLIIPSSLAYGSNGVDEVIPPFTTLRFDIEVVQVKKNK